MLGVFDGQPGRACPVASRVQRSMSVVPASAGGRATAPAGTGWSGRVFKQLGLAFVLAVGLVPVAASQAAITVATNNDEGPGSLRQAILDAPPAETIVVP